MKIMASSPIISLQIDGETMETVTDFLFLGSKITVDGYCSHEIKRHFLLERKAMINLDSVLESRDITLPTKFHLVKAIFPNSHVWLWELENKECWLPKICCFWTVVLEKTLESPLDSKEIKPVNPKRNQLWIFTERTDAEAEAEAPILCPRDVKSQLSGSDLDAWKDWEQEETRLTEDVMVGWRHWLNGQESEQTAGDSEGQRSLECCSQWGYKESDTI